MSASYAGHVERGANDNPSLESLQGLARVLGCTVGWLAAGEGEEPSREQVLRAVLAARLREPVDHASTEPPADTDRGPERAA